MLGPVGRYLYGLAIALDQFGNALTGGSPRNTISSRLGRIKRSAGGEVPTETWLYLGRPLDGLLEWLDENHSIEAVENEEKDGKIGRAHV